MKKSLSILVVLVLVFATAISLVACKDTTEKTPTIQLDRAELTLEEGQTETVYAKVENANGAQVSFSAEDNSVATVNKATGVVTGISAGSTEVIATITVDTKEYSAKCTVTVTETSGMMPMAEKRRVFNGQYGVEAKQNSGQTYYGVGRSLNVIEDEYITLNAGYGKVFDAEKLLSLNWRKVFVGKMDAKVLSGSSMEEFYSRYSNSIGLKSGVGVELGAFSAGIDSAFDSFSGNKYYETENEIFYTAQQIYAATLIELDEYYNLNKFADIFSEEFLQDVQRVQSGTMSAENFIRLYGTHVVLAGYYGGRLDCNYYLRNVGEKWDSQTAIILENKIYAGIGDISAGLATSSSVAAEIGADTNSIIERFEAHGIGGANFSALSVQDFLENYSVWVNSMNDQMEYSNIVGLPNRSLAAIWDLLPSKYSDVKQKLENYFQQQAESKSNEFLSKYVRHFAESVEPPIGEPSCGGGDTTSFAGGFGTKECPYLIANKEHFQNISKTTDVDKYYVLTSSIDLGTWTEQFAFNGNLDGNGQTITFLQYPELKNGTYCYGLFSELNNATVTNLKLDVDISRWGQCDGYNYIGALAGKAIGSNISQIYTQGRIRIASGHCEDRIGGIIGYGEDVKISECYNTADVTSETRHAIAGGIAGCLAARHAKVDVVNCANTGDILAGTTYSAAYAWRMSGGITGQVQCHNTYSININYCYNAGKITIDKHGKVAGTNRCAGLIGDIYSDKTYSNLFFKKCYWTADITSCGNSVDLQKSFRRVNMGGTYDGWSVLVWEFHDDSAPTLRWMK